MVSWISGSYLLRLVTESKVYHDREEEVLVRDCKLQLRKAVCFPLRRPTVIQNIVTWKTDESITRTHDIAIGHQVVPGDDSPEAMRCKQLKNVSEPPEVATNVYRSRKTMLKCWKAQLPIQIQPSSRSQVTATNKSSNAPVLAVQSCRSQCHPKEAATVVKCDLDKYKSFIWKSINAN